MRLRWVTEDLRYFDLHCDTLSRCVDTGEKLAQNSGAVDIRRLEYYEQPVQVFAAFIHDRYTGAAAYDRFLEQYRIYRAADFGKVLPILAVENAAVLQGNLTVLDTLYQMGVRLLTLTWNGENHLGGGADTDQPLTAFGEQVVRHCERLGVVVDVSHLNDRGFARLCEIARRPFIATHSNARQVCDHRRNLDDWQIGQIFDRGGIVGLNLYPPFIGKRLSGYEDLFLHIDRFLKLGGENRLALGTDFDGAELDDRFAGVQDMADLYQAIVMRYSEQIAQKIFYKNAKDFFDKINKIS